MSPANRFRMPPPDDSMVLVPLTDPIHLPIEPFPKLVDVRELSCAGCGRTCRYESSSSGHPGSPEFLRAHPDVWLSFVVDLKTDTLDLIAACSESCMQGVLRKP